MIVKFAVRCPDAYNSSDPVNGTTRDLEAVPRINETVIVETGMFSHFYKVENVVWRFDDDNKLVVTVHLQNHGRSIHDEP